MIPRFSALIASTTLVDPVLSFVLPHSNLTSIISRHASLTGKSARYSSSTEATLQSIAESLRSGSVNQVMIVSGAGVSCAAGIPDFRTPGSGLYDNLHKFNLPFPEAIFDVDFYVKDPMPFVTLAKEIWPGVKYKPTLTHCFFGLLDKKGLLKRVYTQNIDGLEAVAGVNPDKLVECHGHFRSASCISCRSIYDADLCKASMVEKNEAPSCNVCGGVVKPDITFFGEVMPQRFAQLIHEDCASADLVIVLGTSLMVAPVANIPDWISNNCTRLLVNRDIVGTFRPENMNDVILQGDCDEGVRELCRLIGWEEELDRIYNDLK